VIGGGDWAKDRLMTDLIKAFTEGKPALIRNPNAIRPWQHVLEPLRGYLILAESLFVQGAKHAGAWNFGPQDEDAKPVIWLVQQLAKFWGRSANWEAQPGNHPHEAHYLRLDISKARANLGWSPVISIEQALLLTAEWAQKVASGGDARSITLCQIHSYQNQLENLHAK
jgi:CDP-glucose 4,6-dehydratase